MKIQKSKEVLIMRNYSEKEKRLHLDRYMSNQIKLEICF